MHFDYGLKLNDRNDLILSHPITQHCPLLITSPHSGRIYSEQFLQMTRLPLSQLRQSEDSFVEILYEQAPLHGATLLQTQIPRIYCDLNREAWEIDPLLIYDKIPAWCNTQSDRVKRGYGTLCRIANNGKAIYRNRLSFSEAEKRISDCWFPFHNTVKEWINQQIYHFKGCIILDVHSMSMPKIRTFYNADIVLGDAFGQTCSPKLVQTSEAFFQSKGLTVARNMPYAGGYITRYYGNPKANIHAMQIEINKQLYMDEKDFKCNSDFHQLQSVLSDYIKIIADLLQKEILR